VAASGDASGAPAARPAVRSGPPPERVAVENDVKATALAEARWGALTGAVILALDATAERAAGAREPPAARRRLLPPP
jgi:hypothetical protein